MNPNPSTVDAYGRCTIEDNDCRSSRPWDAYTTPATTTTQASGWQLPAGVANWAETNGWHRDFRGVWINPDRTLGVEISDGSDGLGTGFRLLTGDLLNKATVDCPADSIGRVVDLLVALGVLPSRFSSQHWAGYNAGYEHGVQARTDLLAAMAPAARLAVTK